MMFHGKLTYEPATTGYNTIRMKHKHSQTGIWTRQERAVTLDELTWLQSEQGRSVCGAMAGGDSADTPAAIARWRQRLEPERVAAAWKQVTLRAAARAKFSRADEMFFDRISLEQATDEVVARHKAGRFAGSGRVVDLCCGIGGDTLALAQQAEVTALDFSETRVVMAQHNAAVYGGKAIGQCGDAEFDRPEADAVHVDPDRRAVGPRRHSPEAGSPNLDALKRIVQHYQHAAIKLSPGAELDELPFDGEIELISHRGECKQAVVWTGRLARAKRSATVLPVGQTISADADTPLDWPEPKPPEQGAFLYEPDSAVIRANLVGLLARQLDLAPIDTRIAYLVGAEKTNSPFLVPFRIIDSVHWSLSTARKWLAKHDVAKLEIKTRGFAAQPEDIMRRLRLRGTRSCALFLTRVNESPTAILAERT